MLLIVYITKRHQFRSQVKLLFNIKNICTRMISHHHPINYGIAQKMYKTLYSTMYYVNINLFNYEQLMFAELISTDKAINETQIKSF